MQSTKELLIIKQGNIRVNNYICSCALLFDNVQFKKTNPLSVFTISYHGKIYGIRGYTDKNGRVSGKFVNMNSYDASRKNLLSGKTTLSSIIRRLPRL